MQATASKGKKQGAAAITRVLWKEIKPGDRRKFSAKANDEPSGGGARDLRLRGGDDLGAIMEAMFPIERVISRRREGKATPVTRFEGNFCWIETSPEGVRVERSQAVSVEPPTTARPNEWRITRVHTYAALAGRLPPQPPTGRLLLLLVQTADGKIWPFFVAEDDFRAQNDWLRSFHQHVVKCLNRRVKGGRTIFGYFEVGTGREHCNV